MILDLVPESTRAAGLALALLAHYFDPFVRDRRDLEQLGLPVGGELPRRASRP